MRILVVIFSVLLLGAQAKATPALDVEVGCSLCDEAEAILIDVTSPLDAERHLVLPPVAPDDRMPSSPAPARLFRPPRPLFGR